MTVMQSIQLRKNEYASKVGTDISCAVGNTDLPYAVFTTTLSVLQNRVVVGPSFSANFLGARGPMRPRNCRKCLVRAGLGGAGLTGARPRALQLKVLSEKDR